jgi:UDP-glucose 6-dehydrogenase
MDTALRKTKNNKTLRTDEINSELLKYAGNSFDKRVLSFLVLFGILAQLQEVGRKQLWHQYTKRGHKKNKKLQRY